ncbi:MAG: DUF2834 domain-containing protein [Marmoricola sp.]
MTRAETVRCWIFGLIALVALVGTQWALVAYLAGSGSLGDLVDGPGPTFTLIDLLAVAVAATIFMVVEGRRIQMRWLWVYVVLVFTVAVSVAFPLFLIGRTRTLAAARDR